MQSAMWTNKRLMRKDAWVLELRDRTRVCVSYYGDFFWIRGIPGYFEVLSCNGCRTASSWSTLVRPTIEWRIRRNAANQSSSNRSAGARMPNRRLLSDALGLSLRAAHRAARPGRLDGARPMTLTPARTLIATAGAVGASTVLLPSISGYGTLLFQLVALGGWGIVAAITSDAFADAITSGLVRCFRSQSVAFSSSRPQSSGCPSQALAFRVLNGPCGLVLVLPGVTFRAISRHRWTVGAI